MLSTWPCLGPAPTVAHCTHTVPSQCLHIPDGSGHRVLRCTVLWAPSRPPGRLRLGRWPLPALLDPGQAPLGGVPRALRTRSQNFSRLGKFTGGTWICGREALPAGAPAAWGPGLRAGSAGWALQGQLKLSRGEAQSWRWLGTLQAKGHLQEAGCRVPWVSGAVVAQGSENQAVLWKHLRRRQAWEGTFPPGPRDVPARRQSPSSSCRRADLVLGGWGERSGRPSPRGRGRCRQASSSSWDARLVG